MRWHEDGSADAAFRESRVPGAVRLDWSSDLVEPGHRVAFMLAGPEGFERAMSDRGIGDEEVVVAYSDRLGSGPFRLWWASRNYGHDAVRILDGGFEAWLAEERPVERGRSAGRATATWTAGTSLDPRPVATAEDVLAAREDPGVVVLDSRSSRQYHGDAVWFETGPVRAGGDGIARTPRGDLRAGRVPWAVNVPWSSLYARDGRMLPPGALQRLLADVGVPEGANAITYCGVGLSAAALLFALRRAGHEHVSLYDGSWDEWGRLPGAPVARG
jgi:thiosulfate/3-mercaptopyruvate sulfurtransferase